MGNATHRPCSLTLGQFHEPIFSSFTRGGQARQILPLPFTNRGVAGQGPRVVCENFLENQVQAAHVQQCEEAPLRPAGGLGGAVSAPSSFWGNARKNVKISCQFKRHKKL